MRDTQTNSQVNMRRASVTGILFFASTVLLANPSSAQPSGNDFSESELAAIRDGHTTRCEQLFATREGKPLVRGRIHTGNSERPAGTNRFAYSLTEYAAVNLWSGQDLASANEAMADYGTSVKSWRPINAADGCELGLLRAG